VDWNVRDITPLKYSIAKPHFVISIIAVRRSYIIFKLYFLNCYDKLIKQSLEECRKRGVYISFNGERFYPKDDIDRGMVLIDYPSRIGKKLEEVIYERSDRDDNKEIDGLKIFVDKYGAIHDYYLRKDFYERFGDVVER
jgi:hypothetical protein